MLARRSAAELCGHAGLKGEPGIYETYIENRKRTTADYRLFHSKGILGWSIT